MFDLVNDVDAYPQFVEHCTGAQVIEQGEDRMRASLALQRAGIAIDFTTENSLVRPDDSMAPWRVDLQLVDGPFSLFRGWWLFTPLREGACKVSLYIEFKMNSAVASKLASGLFESIANSLVDAFCRRAEQVYTASR